MSNRDALRKLSKQFPAVADVVGIITGLHGEADRTVAIVGSSLVESVLQHLLVVSFKSKAPELLPRLFENRGPLSDFNSKILVAQAFGVIGTAQAEELQRIRHIRNCFAHARVEVTFETPEIAKEVTEFAAIIAIRRVDKDHPNGPNFAHMKNKACYVLICHILMIMLDAEHVKRGGQRLLGEGGTSP